MEVKIFAKINLSLNIVGLSGNMHLLDSIVASVNIFDAISISLRKDNQININFQAQDIPFDGQATPFSGQAIPDHANSVSAALIDGQAIPKENNSVTAAIAEIKKHTGDFGADITVKKGIPIAAGLGGSSADAAGTILLLDKLLGLTKKGIDTKQIASKVGSDTAYMLEGGYARISGTGSIIEKIDSGIQLNIVLASPNKPSLTASVYKEFDSLYHDGVFAPSNNQAIIDALTSFQKVSSTSFQKQSSQALSSICENLGNALYKPAIKLCPEIKTVYSQIGKLSPLGVVMTGSGSMVVGIFDSQIQAAEAAKKLSSMGFFATSAITLGSGFEISDKKQNI